MAGNPQIPAEAVYLVRGGPGWPRSTDQPIMRPTPDRLRECQGVSGVLNRLDQHVVLVSQSVLECHGAVVKTVVKTDALGFASARTDAGGKISQEFTWCVTARQEVPWRVRASQAVSRITSRRRFDGLPSSKPGDTVQRMVQGLREVQEVAADAGDSRVSARPAAAWRGTRNTVPSRAFAVGLQALDAAVRRRARVGDERGPPRQWRGNDREAG